MKGAHYLRKAHDLLVDALPAPHVDGYVAPLLSHLMLQLARASWILASLGAVVTMMIS